MHLMANTDNDNDNEYQRPTHEMTIIDINYFPNNTFKKLSVKDLVDALELK